VAERYPPIEPYASGLLDVGDGHQVYWETVGNPAGAPALWLHGGPGSGCTQGIRRSFDPAAYRVVLFDQRGCGRSRPVADSAAADLTTNTTQHLLGDIELLREHLGIDRWLVSGGSWGVTLALAYAQAHPSRVTAMVLAAVTAGRRLETDWITRDMRRVFPREWDEFAHRTEAGTRHESLNRVAVGRVHANTSFPARIAAPHSSHEVTRV
jgi:proline iminopeptidase